MIILFFTARLFAQQANVPLNYEWLQESEAAMTYHHGFLLYGDLFHYDADTALWPHARPDSAAKLDGIFGGGVVGVFPVQTSMRPWIEQGHPLRKNVTRQNYARNNTTFANERTPRAPAGKFVRWVHNYHTQNSLLQVERAPQNGEPVFRLYIDPLLNLQYMSVSSDSMPTYDINSNGDTTERSVPFYINSRGVTAHGDIGSKVSFETSFWENQAFYPKYIRDFANAALVIPGQGRWKIFKRFGYDYAMASGYVSYSPCANFNMQLGSGKFFVGDGYRSLLLSDNGFNYPYARFTGWFGKERMFQYTTIYASLMNLRSISPAPPGTERLFQKKAASFYQLSMKIFRFGEISLFQGLIWTAADSTNKQCLTLAYANPVIFTSLPAIGMSDKRNYLVGATFRFDLLRTLRFYGQFMADDFGKSGTVHHKTGMQLGLKYFNAFTLKHLHLQFEYNRVQPYSYAATDPGQSYTHYNQPLAHPLGANFSEIGFSLQYKIGDFFLQARYSTATLGVDSIPEYNFGQDVFKTDYFAYFPVNGEAYTLGQGEKTTVTYLDARIGYMVSYASNFNISVGFVSRNVNAGATSTPTSYVYVAARTSLTNTYFDFFRK